MFAVKKFELDYRHGGRGHRWGGKQQTITSVFSSSQERGDHYELSPWTQHLWRSDKGFCPGKGFVFFQFPRSYDLGKRLLYSLLAS